METIFTYTRQNALDDGVLVNVSEMAKEAGFKYPVAITERLHNAIENIPEAYSHEDYNGRLWDILNMCRLYAGRSNNEGTILFQVILHTENNLQKSDLPITLKAMCHPGDNMEPVISIMFPTED